MVRVTTTRTASRRIEQMQSRVIVACANRRRPSLREVLARMCHSSTESALDEEAGGSSRALEVHALAGRAGGGPVPDAGRCARESRLEHRTV